MQAILRERIDRISSVCEEEGRPDALWGRCWRPRTVFRTAGKAAQVGKREAKAAERETKAAKRAARKRDPRQLDLEEAIAASAGDAEKDVPQH